MPAEHCRIPHMLRSLTGIQSIQSLFVDHLHSGENVRPLQRHDRLTCQKPSVTSRIRLGPVRLAHTQKNFTVARHQQLSIRPGLSVVVHCQKNQEIGCRTAAPISSNQIEKVDFFVLFSKIDNHSEHSSSS